jgi:hypothetical protein
MFEDKQGLSPFVAFDQVPDPFPGEPVLKTLGAFVDVVEDFLIGLEWELRRLGYIT